MTAGGDTVGGVVVVGGPSIGGVVVIGGPCVGGVVTVGGPNVGGVVTVGGPNVGGVVTLGGGRTGGQVVFTTGAQIVVFLQHFLREPLRRGDLDEPGDMRRRRLRPTRRLRWGSGSASGSAIVTSINCS